MTTIRPVMQFVVDLVHALRRRLAAEHGGFMIEVMVSAALIVSAGGGVLIAMDAAGRQSGEQRQQAIAADVAQAEMERLRSQKFETLVGLIAAPSTNPVPSGGNTFTVVSRAEWEMQAPPGAVQCTNSARNPETLQISTTVTWPKMSRKPVRLTSLVAAPVGSGAQRGVFVVQITNRDGVGLPGISVSMNGSTPVTGATDANGCVRFTDLTPGPYTIQFTKSGYIDYDGDTVIVENVEVAGGQTRSQPFEIDRSGSGVVTLRYDSNQNSGQSTLSAPTTYTATNQGRLTISHSLLTPSAQTFSFTGGAYTTANLYPFAGGYQVYADSCVYAKPPTPLAMVIDPAIFDKAFTLQLPVMNVSPKRWQSGDRLYVRTACGNIVGPRTLSTSTTLVSYPYGPKDVPGGSTTDGFAICVVDASDNSWDIANVDNFAYDVPQTVNDGSHGLDLSDNNPGARCNGWVLPA